MSEIQILRNQHVELLQTLSDFSFYLDVDKLLGNLDEAKTLQFELFSKLSIHLSIEDKVFYPRFLLHFDKGIKNLARDYIVEMGNISEELKAYRSQWPNTSEIQKKPLVFIEQTEQIFTDLKTRIEKEDEELYRLFEAL